MFKYSRSYFSIRRQIKNGAAGYQLTAQLYPTCFWAKDQFDPHDLTAGFLKGVLLVKVCLHYLIEVSRYSYLCQSWLAMLKSPTDGSFFELVADTPEDNSVPRRANNRCKRPSTKSGNAKLVGMKRVLPRTIAYAASAVNRSLSTPAYVKLITLVNSSVLHSRTLRLGPTIPNLWTSTISCHNNVLDYLENPVGANSEALVGELLVWWDR